MNDIALGITFTKRNFNQEEWCVRHFVYCHKNKKLLLCGSRVSDIDLVGSASPEIEKIKKGEIPTYKDENDRICSKCVSSILAPGNNFTKIQKLIKRYEKSLATKTEQKNKTSTEEILLDLFKDKIYTLFFAKCLNCSEPVSKPEIKGFSKKITCQNCNFIYGITIYKGSLSGSFEAIIDNQDFSVFKRAIGNIEWGKPFIIFSDESAKF